jgi:hypothetical protein
MVDAWDGFLVDKKSEKKARPIVIKWDLRKFNKRYGIQFLGVVHEECATFGSLPKSHRWQE